MNLESAKDYLETVAMDAAPSLEAHDKRFHPNGYKKGDACKFREELAKGDSADLAAAEKAESATPSKPLFEITDETKEYAGHTLRRVKYADGTLGGWVENPACIRGSGRVLDNAMILTLGVVMGNAEVSGDAVVSDSIINGHAKVSDRAKVNGAHIDGNARVKDNAKIDGDNILGVHVYGDAEISGNAELEGSASIADNARIGDSAKVGGNATIAGNAKVYGNAKVGGRAVVFDNAQIYGNAKISGSTFVLNDAVVRGDAEIEGKNKVIGRDTTVE